MSHPCSRFRAHWAGVAVACSAWAGVNAEGPAPVDRATAQTLSTLGSIVLSLDSYRLDHGDYPAPPAGFVAAEFLGAHLSPVYIRTLPTLDGWGASFRYASDGARMAIVSYGPDGAPDREYASLDTLAPAEGAGNDLVWSGGHLVICPTNIARLERLGGQKRTMADLRSIGTAVEAHKIDRGVFPKTDGYVPVAFIRAQIEPFYIRALPLADAWGNTFLYWSDGTHYRIVSHGWDGTADRPYDQVLPGTTTQTFTSDILFGDGEFVQRPEGDQR